MFGESEEGRKDSVRFGGGDFHEFTSRFFMVIFLLSLLIKF